MFRFPGPPLRNLQIGAPFFGTAQSRTQSMPVRRLGAGHDSGETEYRISNFGYPVSYAHAHAQTATLNSRGRH
jgi:hypothetical protein